MNKNKGFTVVELVASFALAMVVFVFLFQIIIVLKDLYINSGLKTELLHKQAIISNKINETFNNKKITIAMTCGENCLFFVYDDNTTNKLIIDEVNKVFTWGDYTTKLVTNSYFGDINISNDTINGVATGKNDSIITIKIPILSANIENQDYGVNIIYQYDSRTSSISSINFNEASTSEVSIFLNGSFEDIKRVGVNYTDPGYFVYYADGNVVFNDPNVTVTSTPVDVSGQTYDITYSYIDNGVTLATTTRTITVVGTYNYSYTGDVQTFTAPVAGAYQIELWGAQGGESLGGKGGYTKGSIYLTVGQQLYIYVGAKGLNLMNPYTSGDTGGYNGGGTGGYFTAAAYPARAAGGGGATDVRLVNGAWDNSDSLKSRIMVAGGGGAGAAISGGFGGNLLGQDGLKQTGVGGIIGGGATQIAGGTGTNIGVFGKGGAGYISAPTNPNCNDGYGAGAGYYGGGGGTGGEGLCSPGSRGSGGGGSSFISGYAGVNAITSDATLTHSNNTKHYSNNYFIDSEMQSNNRTGNGQATITYLASRIYKTTNQLDGVRYIKDCINGNTVTANNHWTEIQAISNGTNVAYQKTATGTVSDNPSYPYTRVTDGNINTANYSQTSATGLQCITVDLGNIYNLDEVAVWHYYGDTRTYNENTTYVSNDNINWTTVINTSEVETQLGKRISAY